MSNLRASNGLIKVVVLALLQVHISNYFTHTVLVFSLNISNYRSVFLQYVKNSNNYFLTWKSLYNNGYPVCYKI